MGCCISDAYRNLENIIAIGEEEVTFEIYSSSNDKILEPIEYTYNILKYISLIEYVNFLDGFLINIPFFDYNNLKINFSSNEKFLTEEISLENFEEMITKKIFVAYESKERIINKEFILPIFKNICQIVYKSLEEKLILHYKKKKYIIKRNILCLGFVYCQSSNIGKIRLFFDLFSKEGKFEKSNELNDFLISLFIIVSHSMVNARIEFSGKHKIPKLKENELNMTYRISELKDSENLLKYFNNNFFKDKKSFDYSEFREKFINKVDTYDWIFSPNGIRYKLEHNNY
jgi:hypothetical protein